MQTKKVRRSLGATSLGLAGGVAVMAKPAEALLFNGVDYQLVSSNLYQVTNGNSVELVQANSVPSAVREALDIIAANGGGPGLVQEGAFSATQSLMVAQSLGPSGGIFSSAPDLLTVAAVGTAGAAVGGATYFALRAIDGPQVEPEPVTPVTGYYTGNPNIDALLYPLDDAINPMAHWEGTGNYNRATELTYSFATEATPTTSFSGFQAFDDLHEEITRDVLDSISDVANIQFTEVTDQGAGTYTADGLNRGHLNFAFDSVGFDDDPLGETEAWAIVPFGNPPKDQEDSGDVHLWTGAFRDMYFEDPLGGGATVLAHEIGHALGLAHPFEEPLMDTWLANDLYTVMSENVEWSSAYGGHSPATPMIYDIAALQHLYGANMATRSGDSIYYYDSEDPVLETIWDAGGTDEIRHTGVSNAVIDLTEGSVSQVGGKPLTKWVTTIEELTLDDVTFQDVRILSGASHLSVALSDDKTEFAVISDSDSYWSGGVELEVTYSDTTSEGFVLTDLVRPVPFGNLGIAFDVEIENATTGAGNDQIYGNELDNRLDPGAGSDIMFGGTGADVFVFKPGYGHDEVGDFESGVDRVELSGFSLDDYTISTDGLSTVLSFNTGDQLTLSTNGPLFSEYEASAIYVA